MQSSLVATKPPRPAQEMKSANAKSGIRSDEGRRARLGGAEATYRQGSALVEVRANNTPIRALVDTGCNTYALVSEDPVSEDLVRRLTLPYAEKKLRQLGAFTETTKPTHALGVVALTREIGGFEQRVYAYAVEGLDEDLFLGKP